MICFSTHLDRNHRIQIWAINGVVFVTLTGCCFSQYERERGCLWVYIIRIFDQFLSPAVYEVYPFIYGTSTLVPTIEKPLFRNYNYASFKPTHTHTHTVLL